jgi:glycosyltransferase involved in cell wall biosynthesis
VKVCLVAHGYPPELLGGTEKAVQALARGLARRGAEVLVVAGSMQHEQGFRLSAASDDPGGGGRPIRVRRIHRADLYFDHWQKSASARVARAFREILREERPDLVHVHHWIRLTRDLVACAAAEGIPAAVTLHDLWTSCLITFRVRPDTRDFCEAPLAADPCLDCAQLVPPRTPWVPREGQHLLLAERRAELVRELALARAVLVPSRAHAESLARFLGLELAGLALEVLPHGRDLALAPRAPLPPPAALGRLVLGSWAHLHPLKGADLVLGALALLPAPRRVELHLAGAEVDAAYAARLRALAAGLEVRFHGAFAEAELGAHPVTGVHAMVSGTRARESFGLVLDEAVALGLPSILPRSGAVPPRKAQGAGARF